MDFTKVKAEIIRKYMENKAFLSKIDYWSYIIKPNHFTFKSSQAAFRAIKSDPEVKIVEEKVSSGKLAVVIEVPEIKLDEHLATRIEIIQDIEFGLENITFLSSNYEASKNFNTKNSGNTKDIAIFDIKSQDNVLIFKIFTDRRDFIEISVKY